MTFEAHFQDHLLSNTFVLIIYLFKSEGSTCFLKFDVEVPFGSVLDDLALLFDGPHGTFVDTFLIENHWFYVCFRFLPKVPKRGAPVDDYFEPLDAASGTARPTDKQAPTGRYNPRIARA